MNMKTAIGISVFFATVVAFGYAFIAHNKYTQFPVYSNFDKLNVLDIVTNPVTDKYIQKKYLLKNCVINEAYLYIEATVDGRNIKTDREEDICFGINKRCSHIMMNNNRIAIPRYLTDTYVYNLADISLLDYDFHNQRNVAYYPNANLIENMTSNKVEFIANISSKDKKRVIHKLRVYYSCENNCSDKQTNCGFEPYQD